MLTNKQKLIIKFSILLLAVVAILFFVMYGLSSPIKKKPRPATYDVPASVLEKTVIQPEFVTSDMNDSTDAVVTKEAVSYWYVYYTFNSEYEGYKVVEISKPYFDLSEAITKIRPNYIEKDFVGIQFFKRVPFETYESYKNMKEN